MKQEKSKGSGKVYSDILKIILKPTFADIAFVESFKTFAISDEQFQYITKIQGKIDVLQK